MNQNRLEQLIKFYEEDPNDPFIVYGLALEYQKSDIKKSEQLFDTLLTNFQEYLPSYYHAAKLKATLGNGELALSIYKKGIALAKKQKDATTERELLAAYNELIFELE
jgi:tetratricopeptide (TPR) repeat protein